MIRLRIAAVALAAAFAGALLALDATAHVLGGSDKDFLERAARASAEEVALGELAMRKGMRDEVKSFAQRVVEDHRQAADQVARLAQSRGVALDAEPEVRGDLEELQDLVGPEFDEKYMAMMRDKHEDAVELFRKQAEDAEDPDVRAFAQRQLLVMEGHFAAAQGTYGATRRTEREYGSRKN